MGDKLHEIFVKTLSSQSEGHAVYQTLLAKDFKPGTCGYIDENGDFNTILQLTEKPELAALGVCPHSLGRARFLQCGLSSAALRASIFLSNSSRLS